MTTAFVFPGQGSQSIGMGKELHDAFPVAREVFEEVDETLSQKLSTLMFEGNEADLNMTENTQPALMAVSIAALRVLEKEGGFALKDKISFVAGHSLGEYSALCAAGSLSLSDTARLLRIRGAAMQKAVPVGVGGMVAILNLDPEIVQAICDEVNKPDSLCAIANDNSPGQIVISGHKEAMDKAAALALEKGAKRALPLPVSAPFHCALMQPAAETMQAALAETDVKEPVVPLIANVTTEAITRPELIRDSLVRQVTGQVRWRESIEKMAADGVDTMVEIGSGKVLCGLIRRINRDIACQNVGTPADLDAFLS